MYPGMSNLMVIKGFNVDEMARLFVSLEKDQATFADFREWLLESADKEEWEKFLRRER